MQRADPVPEFGPWAPEVRISLLEWKKTLALVIGPVLIALFVAFTIYLILQVNADEKQWARLVYLFGGIEAAGLAALGYLFGKEVHRERAEKAEAAVDAASAKRGKVLEKIGELLQFIEGKTSAHAAASRVADDVSALASRARAVAGAPEIMAFIDDLRSRASPSPAKGEWEDLQKRAEELKNLL
jgi:hypothetical protein